jgi:DNA-binding response OmpR family regulator
MRLLVLEDDTFIAEEIKLYFEHKGHEVTCFEEGESLLLTSSLFKIPKKESLNIGISKVF